MQNLHYSIFINAPKSKVWDVMLNDETYRKWTAVFNPTSHYKGDWSEGSEMLFIGSDAETGKEGGMVSRIKENRLHEYLSIEHLGTLDGDVRNLWGDDKGGYENYEFIEKDGGTELNIELTNLPEEYAKMFDEMWPKSLLILKELVEHN